MKSKTDKRLSKLKLFVWTDYSPDYTGGLAVAISRTEKQAREIVIEEHGDTSDWGKLTIHLLSKAAGFAVSGGS